MIIWSITTPEDFWTGFLLAIALAVWGYTLILLIRQRIRNEAARLFEAWKGDFLQKEGKDDD